MICENLHMIITFNVLLVGIFILVGLYIWKAFK